VALATLDFARASAAAAQLAQSLGDAPAAAHGRRLSAALQQAATFADALAALLAGGKVQLAVTGDTAQTVARWQRTDGSLVLLDASKRPAKEVAVPPANVLPEHWAALAAQVQGAPDGSRECFLTFASLAAHGQRARAWLAALAPGKDDSGTGDGGYPLSSGVFDTVLRQLPNVDAPWCEGLRYELAAGRLLASGLRAFSERRNLAAAAQLERLLADHPHSLAVAMLP
jgi:hypothetical protein